MSRIKIAFISLFKYSEHKYNLPPQLRESYKNLFRYLRHSDHWDLKIYENGTLADPKAFLRIIEKEIILADRENGNVIFYLIGRVQTLLRNKTEKHTMFGLYGFLPGRSKNSINLNELFESIKSNHNARIIIHCEDIESESINTLNFKNYAIVNHKFDAQPLIMSKTFERIARKANDSLYPLNFYEFMLQFKIDLNYFGHIEFISDILKEDSFDFPNDPLDFEDQNLMNYLINNIYSSSLGSREDGFNDLKDLLTQEDYKNFAITRLRSMMFLESDQNLFYKIKATLGNRIDYPMLSSIIELDQISALFKHEMDLLPNLIDIPHGKTTLGARSLDKFTPNEILECKKYINEFQISKDLITVRQYLYYLSNKTDGDKIPNPDNWISYEWLLENQNTPVSNVSYYDAVAYCSWLSQHSLDSGLIGEDEMFIIPTEAHWEKVCRGEGEFIYPWGREYEPNQANTKSSGHLQIIDVGLYKNSGGYGCNDLIGNVWEWTSSPWGSSPSKATFMEYNEISIAELTDNDYLVIRGGAYYYDDECTNCITRNRRHPNDKHSGGGFRVALIDSNKGNGVQQ